MAELVDAPASGAGARKGVEVRVLFRAPFARSVHSPCGTSAIAPAKRIGIVRHLCYTIRIRGQRMEHFMKIDGEKIEVSTEEASGGVTNHGVRYVLAASLIIAVVALSAIWIVASIYN
jgi:hypothetical protein